MSSGRIIERVLAENAGPPVDISGAGLDSAWLSMGFSSRALVLFAAGAWAGGTSAVTLEQATDVAGTGAKAAPITRYFKKVAGVWEELEAASNTFDLDTADALYAVELDVADLDVSGGFMAIRARAGSPGANADLLGIVVIPDAHYAGAPADQPKITA